MKIKRYPIARGTVQELESARGSLMSPQQAGAAAGASMDALSQASAAASQDLQGLHAYRVAEDRRSEAERRREEAERRAEQHRQDVEFRRLAERELQLARQEDVAMARTLQARTKNDIDEISISNLPPEIKLRAIEKVIQESQGAVVDFNGADFAANFAGEFEQSLRGYRIEALKAIEAQREDELTTIRFNQLDEAEDQARWDDYMLIANEMKAAGDISPIQLRALKDRMKATQRNNYVEETTAELQELAVTGDPTLLASKREEWSENPLKDSWKQDTRIKLLIAAEQQLNVRLREEREFTESSATMRTNEMLRSLDNPDPSQQATPGDFLAHDEAMKAQVLAGQLSMGAYQRNHDAMKAKLGEVDKIAVNYQAWTARMNANGDSHRGTQPDLKYQDMELGMLVSRANEQMMQAEGRPLTGEEIEDIEIAQYRRYGYLGEGRHDQFEAAKNQPVRLAQAASFFNRLDEGTGRINNIDVQTQNDLRAIWTYREGNTMEDLIRSADSLMAARKAANDSTSPEHQEVTRLWRDENYGNERVQEAMDYLSYSDDYQFDVSNIPGVGGIERLDTMENRGYLREMLRRGSYLYPDQPWAAQKYAMDAFAQTRSINNLNGYMAVDPHGIRNADGTPYEHGRELYQNFIAEHAAVEFIWSPDGGATYRQNTLSEIVDLMSVPDTAGAMEGYMPVERGHVVQFHNAQPLSADSTSVSYDVQVNGTTLIPVDSVSMINRDQMLMDEQITPEEYRSLSWETVGAVFTARQMEIPKVQAEIRQREEEIADYEADVLAAERDAELQQTVGGDPAGMTRRADEARGHIENARKRIMELREQYEGEYGFD